MMTATPNLDLPYIMASQAQKHVTHNEAIRKLDALVNPVVVNNDQTQPPASPAEGECFIVALPASGVWQGHDNEIATWQDGAWAYFQPNTGWDVYVIALNKHLLWDGAAWVPTPVTMPPLQNLSEIGINTSADATNRLSISASGTLLSHEGAGHRMVINKAGIADTASLVFQDNWSGRTEMGLSGDDDFHLKVSTDGQNWTESIVVEGSTGRLTFPAGINNPQLYGTPDNLTAFDRLYIDAVNGDDANDGRSKSSALKTVFGLETRFVIGRKLELRLLSDITFDRLIQIGYVVPQLLIYGRTADDGDWQNRKITVVDSTNFTNHPGSFMFQSFASIYTYRIDVELATLKSFALFDFYNTIGFLRTHTMTLTRTGTGSCCLFANGASFVPSQHTALTIDSGAQGYVANGIAAGADPNDDWRYPSNLSSF